VAAAAAAAAAEGDANTLAATPELQLKGVENTFSPFTFPGEADAAIAAAEAAVAAGGCGSNGGSSGGGWHSPREYAVPRLRSTGSVGTAVEGRQQRGRKQQQQQGGSPRSGGTSSSAPGAPNNQQQQHTPTTSATLHSSSQSTPGTAPKPPPSAAATGTATTEPYDLRVVAHSLGGLSMLMFCVMRAAAGLPHRVRRLVLLSPAGFHDVIPWAWWPFIFVLPYWHRLLVLLLGRDRACECVCEDGWGGVLGFVCMCL
jgi:hypothetical protein